MNAHVNTISNRLSLRQPQRDALEILAGFGRMPIGGIFFASDLLLGRILIGN